MRRLSLRDQTMYAFMGRFMCSLGFVILVDLFSSGTVSKMSMRIHRQVFGNTVSAVTLRSWLL